MATERTGDSGGSSAPGSPTVDQDRRLQAMEARIEHLEKALEGLQDAVYRQAQLEEANISELRRRIVPEQLARDLSQDARQRGI
jgi:hypothetical protein